MSNIVYAPRLRILIDPIYVQISNLAGSSTYYKYVSLVKELVSRGHYIFWCIPDSEYVPNEIENHPNIGIIRTSYIQDQFVIDGLFTDDFFNLFNRMSGKYHIDALVTSRNSLALTYKRTLEAPRFHDTEKAYTDKSYGLPVILLEEFPQTRKRQHSSNSYWLSQCTGYLASDRTVFLSDHNREEVVEGMLDYFKLSVVEKWLKTVSIIPAGIETEQLDVLYDPDRWEVEDKFQVLTVGRLFGPSYVEFVTWFDYLYKAGLDDVCLTMSMSGALSGPMRSKLKKIGFSFEDVGNQYVIYENNPRANFLKMLRKFHCFIATVSHLDHPTGIFEALYMGIPGIIPISDYQKTFFSDYPFVIDPSKKEDLIATLTWIKENTAEARELIKPWRNLIKERYDAQDNIKLLADTIEREARKDLNNFKTSSGVIELVKELKGPKYTFDDVMAYLKNAGTNGVSIGDMSMRTTFTYSRAAIHHAMRVAGFVDLCNNEHEYFVRRDLFDVNYKDVTYVKEADHCKEKANPRKIVKQRNFSKNK